MLSPIDLETREFKKTLGGYNREDVDQFMAMIFQDYKTLYMENVSLKDKVNMLSSAVSKYKSMEEVLQSTLVVAQSASDELKNSAREKAAVMLEEAEMKVGKLEIEARQKLSAMENEYNNIKLQVSSYKQQTVSMLEGILQAVKNLPEEAERNE
ncbi:MAG: DivIVA domain-containing protein [Clostridia bacterium]|nr:DivIVA domain-containing protein [Clostridia bacterium]